MKCPNCVSVSLVMFDRNGIEIDYCPDCRGVWLDRGELDKIIERSQPVGRSQSTDSFQERSQFPREGDYRHKRKKGLLGEIFDF